MKYNITGTRSRTRARSKKMNSGGDDDKGWNTDDGTTAEVLPNLGSTDKVSGDVVEGGGEEEKEGEGEKRSIINKKTGNINKEKMNYAIYDNKKILSRKNMNTNEEIRRFYVKKKDIENKKQINYIASEYKNMMMVMKRKQYDMIKEKEINS